MWLNRVLNNRPIVFQKDIASYFTTMTYGEDVSNQIGNLAGNTDSYGKTFHITTGESLKWEDITSVYERVIKKVTGIRFQIYWTEDSNDISKLLSAKYQVECDRLYDRRFDNSRIDSVTGHKYNYESLEKALSKCVKDYIKNSSRKKIDSMKLFAYMDIISNEYTPLSEIVSHQHKIKYIILRYTPYFKYVMHLKLK